MAGPPSSGFVAALRRNLLLVLILAGAVAGGLLGWFAPGTARGTALFGDLFLVMLRMLVVPLVIASMITGVASLGDVRRLGRTGAVALGYYAATTALALGVGIFVVNLVQPGVGLEVGGAEVPDALAGGTVLGWQDMVRSLFTPNLFRAMAGGFDPASGRMMPPEILPLIVFSLAFGAVLTTLGEKGRPVLAFFEGVDAAIMKLVHLVMLYAPIGVLGLVAGRLAEAGGGEGFLRLLAGLGLYAGAVVIGLAVHAGLTLPLILLLLGRRRPLPYLKGLATALTTAFATASSAATLPLTLEAVEENNRVSPRSARFVLPLGATVNMDGTALYEAVAALFIAQAWGIDLSAGQQLIIFLTATLASIGAAGIPQAGTVTMVIVLNAVGLPLEGIGLILSIDWFLDRLRTTVNVWGDAVGAAVVERFAADGGGSAGSGAAGSAGSGGSAAAGSSGADGSDAAGTADPSGAPRSGASEAHAAEARSGAPPQASTGGERP